jgi:hypothetical protein
LLHHTLSLVFTPRLPIQLDIIMFNNNANNDTTSPIQPFRSIPPNTTMPLQQLHQLSLPLSPSQTTDTPYHPHAPARNTDTNNQPFPQTNKALASNSHPNQLNYPATNSSISAPNNDRAISSYDDIPYEAPYAVTSNSSIKSFSTVLLAMQHLSTIPIIH